MVAEKYAVRLSPEDQAQLERLIRRGQCSARVINRARILLKTDDGWSASQVAVALDTSPRTVFRTKDGMPRKDWAACCTTILKPIGIASWMIEAKPT